MNVTMNLTPEEARLLVHVTVRGFLHASHNDRNVLDALSDKVIIGTWTARYGVPLPDGLKLPEDFNKG